MQFLNGYMRRAKLAFTYVCCIREIVGHVENQVRVTHSKVRRLYRVVVVAAKGADFALMYYLHNHRSASTTRCTGEPHCLSTILTSTLHVVPKHRLIFLPLETATGTWDPKRGSSTSQPWSGQPHSPLTLP
ncbi:uncharacterized protein LOC123505209 isoform X2 [Portunus trituberculatus]|uniref:uncharacterized protein LOC123505209 isoform X2 n=1 Tax=Portunus trituberculatus TaxID=210409 RepID=UPI001E1CB179|nr:uncharacterized protein LOC123505209 isoform X2 [Portunus trituberculatus]